MIYLFIIFYIGLIILIRMIPRIKKEIIKLVRMKRGIDKNVYERFFKDFVPLMEENNLFFYVSEGSALGLYRDEDLIEWDDDLDIGMYQGDFNKMKEKVVPEMIKKGYYFDKISFSSCHFFMKDNHFIDVEVVNFEKKCISKKNGYCKDLNPYLKFDKKSWRGIKLNLPKESYYVYLYGENWKTPIKNGKPKKN